MIRKAFFMERTARQIAELRTKPVYKQRGLVEKIADLDLDCGLVVSCQLVPGNFFRNVDSSYEASRKCYKHGEMLRLGHPETKADCDKSPTIPLQLRAEVLSALKGLKEEEISYIGFSFKPSWGDRLERRVPFLWSPEALRLFAYSESTQDGITVKAYKDAERVKLEGATVLAKVPSRRKDVPEYLFRMLHVPIVRSQHNLATVLMLKPAQLQEGARTVSPRIPHDSANIRYPYETDPEASEVITFYPHDIAAYLGVIRDETRKHNITPLEMNPFALFSRKGAEFYKRLCNNVIVYDPSISTKDHLRKLHLAEKSILLGRAIGKFGHDEIAYWEPSRDGKLKDYDWGI